MCAIKNKKDISVFADDFSNGVQNWTLRGTACSGKWTTKDGALVYSVAPPNPFLRGFLAAKPHFLGLKSLKVAFNVPTCEKFEVDFWVRSYNYTSVCRIAARPNGDYVAHYQRVDSVHLSGLQVQKVCPIEASQVPFAQFNNLYMQMEGQTFTLLLNGQQVLQYTDPDYPVDDEKQVHLRTTVDGTQFKNFEAAADKVLTPAQEDETAPSSNTYTANITVDEPCPWGFTQDPAKTLWKTKQTDFGAAYGIQNQAEYSQTYAFGFEKDTTLTAKVFCTAPAENAQCGLLARFATEGSYLRAGYDFGKKVWFIAASYGFYYTAQLWQNADAPAMAIGEQAEWQLRLQGEVAELYVNGNPVLKACGVKNISYGRMGLFAEGTDFYATYFHCTLPNGGHITGGVIEHTVAPDTVQAHLEIERLDQNTLYGQFKTNRYISYDCGNTFTPAPESFNNTGYGLVYPSMHRRKSDGKFLQVLTQKGFLVQESDDLQNWKDLCHIMPPEESTAPNGEALYIVHVSTFTEIDMPNGGTRLFLPAAQRIFDFRGHAASHKTVVFYSDDGGRSWQKSKKNVEDIGCLSNWHGNMSWCESKIIRCIDGRLRMLCTRTLAPCVFYADSFDNGETWTEYGELKDMPCATSSYAVCEDPTTPNTWYMVYVQANPCFFATICPRNRITLVRTDGLTFTPVMDIDHFSNNEDPEEGMAELYQILDPCIAVFEDYIFVTFGRSNNAGGSSSHNDQRSRFVRIDRKQAGI